MTDEMERRVRQALRVENLCREAHLVTNTVETQVAFQDARKAVNRLLGRD